MGKKIKRSIAVCLLFAMSLGFLGIIPGKVIAAESTPINTLAQYNSSFETVSDVEGWNGGNVAAISFERGKGIDGSGALFIKDTTNDAGYSVYSDAIAVTPGQTYTASVKVSGDGVAHMYLRYYDAGGQQLDDSQSEKKEVVAADGWTTLSIQDAAAPAGAATMRVWLATPEIGKGTICFDNLTLMATGASQTPMVVTNAGFESAAGIPGWTGSTEAYQTTDYALDGRYSLCMPDTSTTEALSVSSTQFPATAGKFYSASVSVYGDMVAKMYMCFYNAEGTEIRRQSAVETANMDNWSELVVNSFVAPKNTAFVGLTIATDEAAQGTNYIDNLRLWDNSNDFVVAQDLLNADFESGNLDHWFATVGEGNVAEVSTDKATADNKYSLKIVDDDINKAVYVVSNPIAVTPGVTYGFSMDTWLEGSTVIKMHVRFYDANGAMIVGVNVDSSKEKGGWKTAATEQTAPDGAATVRINIVSYSSSKGVNGYVDNIIFARPGDADYPKVPEGTALQPISTERPATWGTLNDISHPRLYFNAEELKDLKAFAKDDTTGIYGFSGKAAADDLITLADEYAIEDYFTVTARSKLVEVPTAKLQDPNTLEEFKTPPAGFTGVFPYVENYSKVVYGRLQNLSVAYALTGDTKYSDRCIQYMMDMTEWEYWTDFRQTLGSDPGNANQCSNMDTSYFIVGVATAFDICYDQMTDLQREAISNAMIEKGLGPTYNDLSYAKQDNKTQMRAAALGQGAVAIANASNMAQVEKYMIRSYRTIEWLYDSLLSSGSQEGYSYTSNVIDWHTDAVYALSRLTEEKSLLQHEFLNEVLPEWIVYFMRPGDGKLAGISDANTMYYFYKTLCVLARDLDNGLAGYYLTHTDIASSTTSIKKLLYYCKDPACATEEEIMQTVTHVESFGYGALRSGFGEKDTVFIMIANNSQFGHNQYDQMSFILGSNGQWVATDPGYPTNMGDATSPASMYGLRFGHNTIVIDEQSQANKGNGTMNTVLNSDLYGHISASAPGAYAEGLVTKADRNAIQINHNGVVYYVVIDDLASADEHVYGWNLNTDGWQKLELDGVRINTGDKVNGNHIALATKNNNLFVQFVSGEPVEVAPYLYNNQFGPNLRVNSSKATAAQFMSVINTAPNTNEVIDLIGTIDTTNCTATWNNESVLGKDVKSVTVGGSDCVFFRAKENGHWIELPFNVEKEGDYYVAANVAKHTVYGIYKIYVDGKVYCDSYDGYSANTHLTSQDLGKIHLTKGEHKIRFELIGKNDESTGVLIGVQGVTLSTESNATLGNSQIAVTETYDDATMLGAKLSYAEGMYDVVLFNRGSAAITAGDVVANAAQASVLGISKEKLPEGFALVNGTSLKFGETTMITSDVAISVAADFRNGIVLNTNGKENANVKLSVSGDKYSVYVDGTEVTATMDAGMLCFAVAAGQHEVVVAPSQHEDVVVPDTGYETGDNFNVGLYMGIMLLSVMALGGVILVQKKRFAK